MWAAAATVMYKHALAHTVILTQANTLIHWLTYLHTYCVYVHVHMCMLAIVSVSQRWSGRTHTHTLTHTYTSVPNMLTQEQNKSQNVHN